jgi:hypothetical protein
LLVDVDAPLRTTRVADAKLPSSAKAWRWMNGWSMSAARSVVVERGLFKHNSSAFDSAQTGCSERNV